MKKILISSILLCSLLYSSEEIPSQLEVSKLYVATYNRAPDSSGLEYWTTKSHFKLSQIAKSFFDQEETKEIYPDTTSNKEFIKATYQNLFNREADREGLIYWEHYLNSFPDARDLFIQTLINGAKGSDASILNNKALVGIYFSNASLNDLKLSRSVMKGVTSDIDTVRYIQDKITSREVTTDVWDLYTPTQAAHNSSNTSSNWYKPTADTTWQLQLTGVLNISYDVDIYVVDLFGLSLDDINKLHSDGKRIICYFSAGSAEDWRDDYNQFPPEAIGNDLSGWPGERWLDIRNQTVKDIMLNRLDVAVAKGCDGVDLDNVDAYEYKNKGLDFTYNDQLTYNISLAQEAHKRGLAVALKNDLKQVKELEPYFDMSIIENCHLFSNCDYYSQFTDSNKPIFNVDYNKKYIDDQNERYQMCQEAESLSVHTLLLSRRLNDEYRYSCD
jgi:hypothetical protein